MASKQKQQGNTPELLNSSFYSSSSINTLDHVRNFRNSLILRDMSDQSIDVSIKSKSSFHDSDDLNGNDALEPEIARERETVTMKMSTSPSLSALAGILSEKTRQSQEVAKKANEIDSSILEEEEEPPESVHTREDSMIVSPNLIDVDDSNTAQFPKITASTSTFISEQPDFLSSPRKEQESLRPLQDAPGRHNDATRKPDSKTGGELPSSLTPNRVPDNSNTQRQSSGSGEPTHRFASTSANDSASATKKRKNIFSFLRKKTSRESLSKERSYTRESRTEMSNSTSFSTGTVASSPPPSTRITKKSYSSSNIFNTFKKNKDYKKENSNHSRSQSTAIPSDERYRAASRNQNDSILSDRRFPSNDRAEKKYRKPTPLNFEHIVVKEPSPEPELPKIATPSEEPSEETLLPADSRLDTGEVLFPKSLSKQEVDSIVSLERSRSTKSNKRSSIASHRRSLTDTLSINAQNEGMFVTEASSIVMSTPDLSKSPTNSILRNGKFETLELPSSSSVVQDDRMGMLPVENLTIGSELGFSPKMKSFSLDSIGEKLKEMTYEADEEIKMEKDIFTSNKETEDDPELMSDIMEFASLINFGDGINLEIDDNTTETRYKTMRPATSSTHSMRDIQELDSMHLSQSQIGSERDGLDFSSDEELRAIKAPEQFQIASSPRKVNQYHSEAEQNDDFENEDFNEVVKSPETTPQLRQFVSDSQLARPMSMSFRGPRVPSSNTSLVDSTATESFTRATAYGAFTPIEDSSNSVNFSSRIILYDTYAEDEYDRKPDIATCNQLTPQLAQLIKAELNELKCEMEVHEESKCYTHFY